MAEGEQPGRAPRQRTPKRSETIEEVLLKNAPWMSVEYTLADATAMQALAAGTASAEQQRRALRWIQAKACGLPDWAFRPGGTDRDTNIALGRQFVGHQIQRLITAPIASMPRSEHSDPHEPKD